MSGGISIWKENFHQSKLIKVLCLDYYFLNNIFFFLTLLQKLYSKSQYKITIKAVDNFQIFLLIVHFIICFATDTVVALIDSVPETMGALIDSDLLQCKHFV